MPKVYIGQGLEHDVKKYLLIIYTNVVDLIVKEYLLWYLTSRIHFS